MAKEEWGSKHICPECGAKFYDLLRDPVHCPKCGREIIIEIDDSVKPGADEDDDPGLPDEGTVVIGEEDESDVAIDDNVLDDSEDDAIPLEEITDMPDEDED